MQSHNIHRERPGRPRLIKRGPGLEYFTMTYNIPEGVTAIATDPFAGSIDLKGFGFDSVIEVTPRAAHLWRLRDRRRVIMPTSLANNREEGVR